MFNIRRYKQINVKHQIRDQTLHFLSVIEISIISFVYLIIHSA